MQVLDESSSGTIQKQELQDALLNIADKHDINLDVDAIVQLIFNDSDDLSRG